MFLLFSFPSFLSTVWHILWVWLLPEGVINKAHVDPGHNPSYSYSSETHQQKIVYSCSVSPRDLVLFPRESETSLFLVSFRTTSWDINTFCNLSSVCLRSTWYRRVVMVEHLHIYPKHDHIWCREDRDAVKIPTMPIKFAHGLFVFSKSIYYVGTIFLFPLDVQRT